MKRDPPRYCAMVSSFWLRLGGLLTIVGLLLCFGQGFPFQAEAMDPLNFSIAGEVKRNEMPVGGVRLLLFAVTNPNSPIQSTQTSLLGGSYRFDDVAPGEYVVYPQDNRYLFEPIEQRVEVVESDVANVNFVATLAGALAGGRVEDGGGGGIFGIDMALYDGNSDTPIATTQSNQEGAYAFPNLEPGSYQIKPSSSIYNFTPLQHTFTISDTSIFTLNFAVDGYTVSGRVLEGVANGLEGVNVTLTTIDTQEPVATAVTNKEGTYIFTGVVVGSYRITPMENGYLFTPPYQDIMVSNNTLVQFFRAEPTGNGNYFLYLPITRRR